MIKFEWTNDNVGNDPSFIFIGTARLSILTAKGGPVPSLLFIPSSSPSSIYLGSGILELFVSNIPGIIRKKHGRSSQGWERLGQLSVLRQSEKLPPPFSTFRRRYFAASDELKESTRVAAASRTSTLFAVFKNLNASSPSSLYIFFSLSFSSYTLKVFPISSFRFIALYRSVKSNGSLMFPVYVTCFLHSTKFRYWFYHNSLLSFKTLIIYFIQDVCVILFYDARRNEQCTC